MERSQPKSRPSTALYILTSLAVTGFSVSPVACGLDCKKYDGCADYSSNSPPGGSAGGPVVEGGSLAATGTGGQSSGGASSGNGSGSGSGTGGSESAGVGGSLGADGGEDGSGGCDSGAAPSSRCPVVDDAIFVAPDGEDENEGTREAPLRTLTAAVARASAERKRVMACQGTFFENVVMSREVNAPLQGGYQCKDGWKPGEGRTLVKPATGIPLVIQDVERLLEIEGFELQGPPGSAPSENSIGAVVTDSTVVLKGVLIAAGDGRGGADGEPVPSYMAPAASGHSAEGPNNGGGAIFCGCSCIDCNEEDRPRSSGGRGGDGGSGVEEMSGQPGEPASESGGLGGVRKSECGNGGSGQRGAFGAPAADGEGAKDYGVLLPSGEWEPAAGTPGADGKVAQGGGGGRGGIGGGGGGGACGGCGGKGGASGGGGGASIGLISVNASVTLVNVEITTGKGGDGGVGSVGQPGQLGGPGGNGADYACDGGDGGDGSQGGTGGSGAGGLSVGILFTGQMPTNAEETRFYLGDFGKGGDGSAGLFGTDGQTIPTLDLTPGE